MPTPMSSSPARFHLISGNRLDALADHLGARLAEPREEGDLAPDVVLIPQPTLRQWLLQTLAERLGVAAHLRILTPSEFTWEQLRAASPALPDASPWDRDRLRWRLYAQLAATRTLPPAVDGFLARARSAGRRDGEVLARFALAEALAGAFDKYQAYRRDWLERWDAGEDRDDWQAILWRQLREGLTTPHRAALVGEWLARFDPRSPAFAGVAPPGLPARIAAFGTIHVSPDVLHLLAVVGQWSALDFYLPSPSAAYWGDVESLRARLARDGTEALPAALADLQMDNPLLAAWGAGGREIIAQLYAYDVIQPAQETECFVPPPRDTLLHRLQADVFERVPPTPGDLDPRDASVQVHACHSRLREVEVLHDRLRALLDDPRFDPPLEPREIAVLAPDIAAYLPLARAVFGGIAPDDPRYIPFSLADRPQLQTHPLMAVLQAMLDLADAPMRASEFLDLLAVPSVARAHGLDPGALARVGRWLDEAGVRWGDDEESRERAGVGRWREFSFAFGLERLLAGYAAGVEGVPGAEAGIAPYVALEGGDAGILDAVLVVHERLHALATWMRTPHTAQEWQRRLAEDLVAIAGAADDDDDAARRRMLEALADFAAQAADAGPLPASLVRRTLLDTLAQPSPHQPWLAGGVTFAGMVPLRTVPFRVICLLGMDADAYPRREPADDVNRLVDAVQGRAPRRIGDRSVRDDDRFLFLQLLCAAGDVLHISHGGRDARNDDVREPATMVVELLDAIEAMHGPTGRAQCQVTHPLQPFSPRAFGRADDGVGLDMRRRSYRDEWWIPLPGHVAAEPPFAVPLALPAPAAPDRAAVLRDFLLNPSRAWLRDRLGVQWPGNDAGETVDREPLGPDRRTRWSVIEAAVAWETQAPGLLARPGHVQPALRAHALLPPGHDGDALVEEAVRVARLLVEARDAHRAGAPVRRVAVHGDDAPHGLAFAFDDVHGATRVIATAGKQKGKRRVRAAFEHLLLASVLGEDATTVLITEGEPPKRKAGEAADAGPVLEERCFAGVSRARAREALGVLLALWHDGQRSPLPFMPDSAATYVDTLATPAKGNPTGRSDEERAWRAARDTHARHGGGGEQDDPWVQLAFRPHGLFPAFSHPVCVRFREVAEAVFRALEGTP